MRCTISLLIFTILQACTFTPKVAKTISVKARGGVDTVIKVYTPEETTQIINDMQTRYLTPDTSIFKVVDGMLIFKDSIILGNVTVKSLHVGLKDTITRPLPDTLVNHIP